MVSKRQFLGFWINDGYGKEMFFAVVSAMVIYAIADTEKKNSTIGLRDRSLLYSGGRAENLGLNKVKFSRSPF